MLAFGGHAETIATQHQSDLSVAGKFQHGDVFMIRSSGARVIFYQILRLQCSKNSLTWLPCRATAALLTALGSKRKNCMIVRDCNIFPDQ